MIIICCLFCIAYYTPREGGGPAVRIRTSAPGRFHDGSLNSWSFRAEYYTPEVAKVKFRWRTPLEIHWKIPVIVHWKVTILWKIPPKCEIPLENTADNPLVNATEHPRRLLRCRFLVCN